MKRERTDLLVQRLNQRAALTEVGAGKTPVHGGGRSTLVRIGMYWNAAGTELNALRRCDNEAP